MGALADLRRGWRRFRARPSAARAQLIRALANKVRTGGPSAALAWIRSNSVPDEEASRYLRWCEQHTPNRDELRRMRDRSSQFIYQPLLSILTPVYNTDPKWLEACADSVIAQAYPRWEWRIGNDGSTKSETVAALAAIAQRDPRIHLHSMPANGGIAAATNLALSNAAGEYVALMDSDDALLPHALFRMVEALNAADARPDVLYSDEDKLEVDGRRCDAYFKPDWSPDLFLSSMFACHLLVARRSLVESVGGFRTEYDFSQDYDLMLRLMEKAEHIAHVPDILYHWRKIPLSGATMGDAKPAAHVAGRRALQNYLDRNGIPGEIVDAGPPGLYRAKYRLERRPLVSVLIATRGAASPRLVETLTALAQTTAYRNLELVLVSDDGTIPSEAGAAIGDLRHRVLQTADVSTFNFSRKINQAAGAAAGEHLLILHDDVRPLDAEWLETMLELSEQRGIGVVGAKLYYPHGALQHIGLILGLGGLAGRPFQGYNGDAAGYYSAANCIRNYSAVSAACLMTRRDVFTTLDGLDEGLPLHGSDIDYGLKAADAGLRVVFTPYARLTHYETGQFGAKPVSESTMTRLRARWGERLDRDPYYNPNLSLDAVDYRVAL